MTARQYYPVSLFFGSLFLIAALLLLPGNASAEPHLFLSIVENLEVLDIKALNDFKLSAKLKTDKYGNLVFQCLNFTKPVADNPFENVVSGIKLNQIEVKAVKRGVAARVAFSF